MKHLFTLCALLLVSVLLNAQITIERSDFTLEPGDRVNAWLLDITDAFVPEHGENMVWDYSNLLIDQPVFADYSVAASSDFPDADFFITFTRDVLGGVSAQRSDFYYELDGDVFRHMGEINESLNVPLRAVTGSPTDTLKILETMQFFQEPKVILPFPLNYGDNWSSDNTLSLEFLISVANFGLQDAPSGQTVRDMVTDSVLGYGTLILPNPDGSGSVSIESLLTKRTQVSTLNYTLGGQPAPQIMLDALGLVQGTEVTFVDYIFYAKGLPRSAAIVELDNLGGVFTMAISDDIKDLTTSATDRLVELLPVKAFPNPASEAYQLSFDKPDPQTWTLEMFNTLGRQVHHQSIESGDGPTQITVSCPTLHAGHYTYVLRNKAGSLMASGSVLLH